MSKRLCVISFVVLFCCVLSLPEQVALSANKAYWRIEKVDIPNTNSSVNRYENKKPGNRLTESSLITEGSQFIIVGDASLKLEGISFEFKVPKGQRQHVYNAPYRTGGEIPRNGRRAGSRGDRSFPTLDKIFKSSAGIPVMQLDVNNANIDLNDLYASLKPYVTPGSESNVYKLTWLGENSPFRLKRPDGTIVRILTNSNDVDEIIGLDTNMNYTPMNPINLEYLKETLRVEIFRNYLYSLQDESAGKQSKIGIRLIPVSVAPSGIVVNLSKNIEYMPVKGPIEWDAESPFMIEVENKFGKPIKAVLFCLPVSTGNSGFELLWPSLESDDDILDIPSNNGSVVLGKDTFKDWDKTSGVFSLENYRGLVLIKMIAWSADADKRSKDTIDSSRWSTAEVLLTIKDNKVTE